MMTEATPQPRGSLMPVASVPEPSIEKLQLRPTPKPEGPLGRPVASNERETIDQMIGYLD
ncbi:MAG: hypothetical protein IGQ88_10135 [Gloeomargaritaceae cyanobacterium C42_A2020_066]|nr:hypothetical protein [Gloeomargaritaceae cyanobacterium C42_A2020_066]